MSVKVYVNYDGKTEEILIKGIGLKDDMSFDCTAYEYGCALADVMGPFLREHISADFEVCSEDGIPLHCLKINAVNGDCTVSDRVEGAYRPSIPFKARTEKLPDKYLIMVDAGQNKNEYYKMSDMGGGEWSATYGRVGEKQGRSRATRNVVVPKGYPDYMFGIKLMEKLSKGYQDKSECHGLTVLRKINPDAPVSGIENKQVAELIEKLMAYAQNVIVQNYTVSFTDVTPEMIKQASAEIDCMRASRTLSEFNEHLLSLMHIIPRKIDGRGNAGVKRMLASDVSGYADILVRETELLDIMEGQIVMNQETKQDDNILDKMGLTVKEATHEEIELVRDLLNNSLKPRLKQVFAVCNQNTRKRFEEYLSRSDNKKKDITKLFWHGSRNANWFSILQKGLMLNPDAVITGKMFGNGIYFAPSAMKSWGYTSSRDAKWNGEASNEAYMALYETAYGSPYEVDTYGNWSGYSYKRLQAEHPGCSCVHAKKDKGMLYDDEVIFYREDQITIRYICAFETT